MKKYKKHSKVMKNLEKKLTIKNKKRVKKVFKTFAEKIQLDNGKKYSQDIDEKIIIDIDYEYLNHKIKNMLEKIYMYNIEDIAGSFRSLYNLKKIDRKVIKGVRDYFLEEWNKKNLAKHVTKISDTTRKIINQIISDGQKEGLSHKNILQNIISKVADMTESRASTIARTETSTSINVTSHKIAADIKMKEKGWIHLGGKKTYRENHRALNGKWIGIEEKFDLGHGLLAKYPHDENLPASEIVNCRCLIIFR